MSDSKLNAKPGRPPCDVSEQVFAYVAIKEKEGMSLSRACRDGLVVLDSKGKVLRAMRGNHLEAIFRHAERERKVPWERPTSGYSHAVPTFMLRPLPTPIGAATSSERVRGRPKKSLAHKL